MSTLKLPASSRCVKYLMFVFNLLFVITGIILLSIGATIHAIYHNYQHFLDNKFFSVPNLLIAIGAIIFIIAFFGCCGAVRENYCMIVTFASLMVLIFILELSGGISGYVLRNRVTEVISEKMIDTMPMYAINNSEIFEAWDTLQEKFDCCGVKNATDWIIILKTSEDIPVSCCAKSYGDIGKKLCNINSTDLHQDGCLSTFGNFIRGHAVQLGGVGIGVAFVQGVGVWFAIYLARSIKNSYETV